MITHYRKLAAMRALGPLMQQVWMQENDETSGLYKRANLVDSP